MNLRTIPSPVLASPMVVASNRLVAWLREMDALRQALAA